MTTRRTMCRLILAALVTGASVTAVSAQQQVRVNTRGETAPGQPRPRVGGGQRGMSRQRYSAGGATGRRSSYTIDRNGDMKFNANNAFGQRRGYQSQSARGYGGRSTASRFRSSGQY